MKILTVHGWAFCPVVFKNLPEGAEHFHINHSKSLEENIALLRDLIDKETVLVGWSLGATLSVLAAVKKQPRGMVLIGATPFFKKAWKTSYIEKFLKELEENFEKKITEFRKNAYGEINCPIPYKDGAIKLLNEFIETDISPYIRDLKTKTILLHGRKDFITPFREFKKLLKLNNSLKGRTYNGGHFPIHFSERDWEKIFESF